MGFETDFDFLAMVYGPDNQVFISVHFLTEDVQLMQMPALKRVLNEVAARMSQIPA